MDRFSLPPAAACVLAFALLILVVFVCVWISVGGGPWERFHNVLELWTASTRS